MTQRRRMKKHRIKINKYYKEVKSYGKEFVFLYTIKYGPVFCANTWDGKFSINVFRRNMQNIIKLKAFL